ncbi:MAG TPA: outer membrane beta-barrel protein [Cytophagaceae bacterium]|jgi:hypothetical protein|nr:outer membrane beta-barrel protein [Cytophagaceae bacterium]
MYLKSIVDLKWKTVCLLTVSFLFYGKEVKSQSFKGIITVGANACQIDGDRLSGFHKPGYMLGLGVERKLTKRMSLLLGLEFMEKGSKTSSKDSILYFKWKMDYLDIPLVFSWQAHQRFRFQAGITPSVLLNDKIDYGTGFTTPAFQDDRVNLLIAPAVEFFPSENISLLMRYQYSLIRFNSHVPNTVAKYHNLITVGLRFYLGGDKE